MTSFLYVLTLSILSSASESAIYEQYASDFSRAGQASLLDLPWVEDGDQLLNWQCKGVTADSETEFEYSVPVLVQNVRVPNQHNNTLNYDEPHENRNVLCHLPDSLKSSGEVNVQSVIDECRKKTLNSSIQGSLYEDFELSQDTFDYNANQGDELQIRVLDGDLLVKSINSDDKRKENFNFYLKCSQNISRDEEDGTPLYAIDDESAEEINDNEKLMIENFQSDKSFKDWYRLGLGRLTRDFVQSGGDYTLLHYPEQLKVYMKDEKPYTSQQWQYIHKDGPIWGWWPGQKATKGRKGKSLSAKSMMTRFKITTRKICNRPVGVNPDIAQMKKDGRSTAFGYIGPHTDAVGVECGNGYWNGLTRVKPGDCIGVIMYGGMDVKNKRWNLCTRAKNM